MTDDESADDPFDEFERPDEDDDPFADLDADTDDQTDGNPTDDGPVPVDEETDPGRLPDDPFTNRDTAGTDRPPGIESGPDPADGETAAADTTDTSAEGAEALGSMVNEPSVPESGGDDPFADLGGGPQPRTRDDDDGDDPFDSFESVDVDEVDPDEVWSNLSSLEDATEEFDGRVYYEVSKHRFCEQCQYFSGPPEASCTFEGADIVEFVDMETVRLVNCPVVAEQEELGEDVTRYEPE